ncbi:MAG: YitT family protein [Oscillospiraceae bacterium]|nr:YitT family protein [Oscillospiraceae bacterium]
MKSIKKPMTYLVIALMAAVHALNYQVFVFPNSFAPAGINGICTMIQYMTGISVGYMSLLINIPLAIWVYLKVSRTMGLRSMVYVVVSSVMLVIFNGMDMSAIAYVTENGTSTILGPLVGGIAYGSLYAILVRVSATSGGTDFIAAIIHKYRPEKSMFWIIFALNVFVAFMSFFVYDYKIEPVIMCIMYCFTSSMVTDKMSRSGRAAVRFEIITDYPDEISNAIITKLHHSATLLPGRGMYQGKEVSVLICVVNKNQMARLADIVRQYPHTFAVMSSVNEVMGNFKKIDTHGNQEKEILDHGDVTIT